MFLECCDCYCHGTGIYVGYVYRSVLFIVNVEVTINELLILNCDQFEQYEVKEVASVV
jgi:hypothetical protein